MFGAYEPDPLMLDPRERAPGFQIADLEFDMRAAAAQDGRRGEPSFRCSAMRRSPSCAAGCRR